MRTLNVATGNRDKFQEIRLALNRFGIEARQEDINFVEKESTLEGGVKSKIRQAWKKVHVPVLVDDTGIFFTAFENFPGHEAKRVFEEIGYEGLLEKLKNKPRGAYFKAVLAFTEDGKTITLFDGILEGAITKKVFPNDRPGFPYDAIFVPAGSKKPYCQFSREEMLAVSHRAKAVRKFAAWYKTNK